MTARRNLGSRVGRAGALALLALSVAVAVGVTRSDAATARTKQSAHSPFPTIAGPSELFHEE